MDGMSRWMNRLMDEWMDGWMDRVRSMDGWIKMDGWMDGGREGLIDRDR